MIEGFVPSLPTSQWKKPTFGADVCRSSNSISSTPQTKSIIRMASDKQVPKKPEEKGLGEWLYRKFMHNALWEGDENVGYELYFKDAMSAREAKKKEEYEKENGSN